MASYSLEMLLLFFFFSSRRRHTRWTGDWSSDVCSSDLKSLLLIVGAVVGGLGSLAGMAVGALFIQFVPGWSANLSSAAGARSEERRVGKECRSRGTPYD